MTGGNVADIKGAAPLLAATEASKHIIADKGYDADHLRSFLHERGTKPVIPNKTNRKRSFPFDAALYGLRNIIDIDQAWRLSRLCGGDGGFVGRFRRQAAPGRRGGADRLQRRDRLGIGAHEHRAFRAGADVAAG